MKLVCKECGKEYESGRSSRQFCSKKCSIDNRKKDPEYIKKLSKKKTKKETTVVKCKYCGELFNAYGKRKFCSLECSNKYKASLVEKITVACKYCGNTFERLPCSNKTFCSNICVVRYNANNPAYKQKLRNAFVIRSKDPEYLEKLSAAHTAKWADPEFRKKMTSIMQSDEWNDKVEKNSKRFKDYILPSGKIVRIQGYEGLALDKLLKDFDETDLLIQRKEIENEIGKIIYKYNDIEHQYIPDIYIKSLHKIIEVKSSWTYKSQLELNKLKEQSCIDAGLNFEFMIL